MKWASACSREALYIVVAEKEAAINASRVAPVASLEVKIEPQRLYPARHFVFDTENPDYDPVHIAGYPLLYRGGLREVNEKGVWYFAVRIPFKNIGLSPERLNPIRMDVIVRRTGRGTSSWRPDNPTTSRLILGSDNPDDLGWLRFVKE